LADLLAGAALLLCPASLSAASPGWEAGNGKLAFVGHKGDLYVALQDGSLPHDLVGSWRRDRPHCTRPCRIWAVTWSPDGRRIAFLRGDQGSGPGCSSNCRGPRISLFVIDPDGRNLRRLVSCHGTCDLRIAWSPDSSRIALETDSGELVAVDVRTQARHRLTGPGEARSPAWAPDGSAVAFITGETVLTVNARGRPRQKALAQVFDADNPVWAPDSQSLVIDGGDGIYSVRADGSERRRRILSDPNFRGPYAPSFSPDGSRLLYYYTPGQRGRTTAELWVMRPDGTHRMRVYASPCCLRHLERPIWSPDGERVVLSANSAGGSLAMDIRGRHRERLTPFVTALSWQVVHEVGEKEDAD
jgi:Tol biopolymer transport system component